MDVICRGRRCGKTVEVIFYDEVTLWDPKQYKAMVEGEWGKDTGDIEPQIIEPTPELREGEDFISVPTKRMTKKEMESIYGVKPEE